MSSDEESMEHVQEHIHHSAHGASESWIGWAALTAAVFAALAAIGGAMGSENLNESSEARITANDQWGYYQAKSIKSAVLKTKMEILKALNHEPAKAEEPKAEESRTEEKSEAAKSESAKSEAPKPEAAPKKKLGDKEQLEKYEDEMKETFDKAKELEAESTAKTKIYNTFEHGVTLFHIAIAVVAISVLTKRKRFWFVSLVFGAVGIVFIIMALVPHLGNIAAVAGH